MEIFQREDTAGNYIFTRLWKTLWMRKTEDLYRKLPILANYNIASVQVAVNPSGRKLLEEMNGNVAELFNMADISTGWQDSPAKL